MTQSLYSQDQLKRQFLAAATPSHLGLMVSPTEQCNFRCTYCYEDFELGRMGAVVWTGLRRLVERSMPELRSFSLNWFGGEPLLEWRTVGEFTAYCRERAAIHGVHMPVASTPTNAWSLTPARLRYLVDSGVGEFMISLDGLQEQHDRTRRLISGRGTFERLYRNLLALRDAADIDAKIILRLHLHRDNAESQLSLAHQLKRDFGGDTRFIVHPIALGNFGGPTIDQVRLLHAGESHTTEQEIASLFGVGSTMDAANEALAVCYAAKPNHIIVRPNGRLAKCTSALGRSDNDVGELLSDGTLSIDADKAALWSFGFKTGRADHLACPFFEKPREAPVRFFRDAVPPIGT